MLRQPEQPHESLPGIETNQCTDHEPNGELRFLWIELTNRCNLECGHCYSESSPSSPCVGQLGLRDFESIIGDARKLGCSQVQFIGGEPTLSTHLLPLIDYSAGIGLRIEVFTNLTRLSDALLLALTRHRVAVATSFYSHDATVHDRITTSKGSHSRTTANIRRVVEAGLALRVGLIVMDENRGGTRETERYLRDLGVSDIGFDEVRALGRAQNACSDHDSQDLGELCGHCGHGRLAVAPDGTVYPCVMSRKWALGSVRTDSLSDLLASASLATFKGSLDVALDRRYSGHDERACAPNDSIIPCYPDAPCSPKNPCWPDKAPCSPDRPGCLPDQGLPPCSPKDCMPRP